MSRKCVREFVTFLSNAECIAQFTHTHTRAKLEFKEDEAHARIRRKGVKEIKVLCALTADDVYIFSMFMPF